MKNLNVCGIAIVLALIVFFIPACGNPTDSADLVLWDTWSDPTARSTIEISVNDDGVCNVTIGGTADPDPWLTSARYKYTSKANTEYSYKFEAWTDSGDRLLNIQYGGGLSGTGPWETTDQLITAVRKTYTITKKTEHDGPNLLEFRSADQLGTFHVKVLSIVPVVNKGIIPKWVGTYEASGDTATLSANGTLSWTGWYGIPDGSRTGATITEGGLVSGGGFAGEWVYLTVNGDHEGIIIHIVPKNELGWNYIVAAGSHEDNGVADLLSLISEAGVTLSPPPRTYGYPSNYYFMGGR